jgi:hypothetical protein
MLAKQTPASRRIPSNRRLASSEIMQWDFDVKVMELPISAKYQWRIRAPRLFAAKEGRQVDGIIVGTRAGTVACGTVSPAHTFPHLAARSTGGFNQRTRCGDFVKPCKGIVYENNVVDGGNWLPPPRLRLDSDGDTCGCARHAGAARCLRAGRLSALQPVHPRRKAYRKLPPPQPRQSQPGLPQGVQQWSRAALNSAAVRLTRGVPRP